MRLDFINDIYELYTFGNTNYSDYYIDQFDIRQDHIWTIFHEKIEEFNHV